MEVVLCKNIVSKMEKKKGAIIIQFLKVFLKKGMNVSLFFAWMTCIILA